MKKKTSSKKSTKRKVVQVKLPVVKKSHKKVVKKKPIHQDGGAKVAARIIKSDAAKELYERRQMRLHLEPFIKRVFQTVSPGVDFLDNWHIGCMAEYLELAFRREIRRLIINIPPRFLKSISGSVALPAWGLGLVPSERFMCASYIDTLSTKHSVDTRLVVESSWYKKLFPKTRIAMGENEKTKFVTTRRGHRMSTSVGGNIVGLGGNILIIDDPHNPKSVLSDKDRTFANVTWHDQSMSNRYDDPKSSVKILIMQRLHVHDMTGHMLDKYGDEDNGVDIVHLCIEQEAEKRKTISFPITKKKIVRNPGDLIHAERFGITEANIAKIDLLEYGWAGQQQQRPVPLGGNRIKIDWFPTYMTEPECSEILQTWDTASSKREVNNPSACLTLGRKGKKWYLLDAYVAWLIYPDLKASAIIQASVHKPDTILIEDKSSGIALIQDLFDETDLPVIAIQPEADKVIRMDTQTSWISVGNLVVPDKSMNKKWMLPLMTSLCSFPNPPRWDEIDALSQAIKWIKQRDNTLVTTVLSIPKVSTFKRGAHVVF